MQTVHAETNPRFHALLSRLQGTHRLPGAGQHQLQCARRADRLHAGRRLPLLHGHRDRRRSRSATLYLVKDDQDPCAQTRLQGRFRTRLTSRDSAPSASRGDPRPGVAAFSSRAGCRYCQAQNSKKTNWAGLPIAIRRTHECDCADHHRRQRSNVDAGLSSMSSHHQPHPLQPLTANPRNRMHKRVSSERVNICFGTDPGRLSLVLIESLRINDAGDKSGWPAPVSRGKRRTATDVLLNVATAAGSFTQATVCRFFTPGCQALAIEVRSSASGGYAQAALVAYTISERVELKARDDMTAWYATSWPVGLQWESLEYSNLSPVRRCRAKNKGSRSMTS